MKPRIVRSSDKLWHCSQIDLPMFGLGPSPVTAYFDFARWRDLHIQTEVARYTFGVEQHIRQMRSH